MKVEIYDVYLSAKSESLEKYVSGSYLISMESSITVSVFNTGSTKSTCSVLENPGTSMFAINN